MLVRKKSVLVVIVMVALLIFLITQCTGSRTDSDKSSSASGVTTSKSIKNSDSTPRTSSRTLNVSVSMDPVSFVAFQKLSNAYLEAHSGLTIKLENIDPKEAYIKFKKASQLGEASDVLLLDNNWINEFAALGYLSPVDVLFTTDMQAQRVPVVLNQVKWNGYIWGVPNDIDPYIFVWNKKTALEAKRDKAPETPDEMVQWSRTFAKPETGKYGIYVDLLDPELFIATMSSLTGTWLDPTQVDKKWSDPAIMKTVESFLIWDNGSKSNISKAFPQPSSTWDPWALLQQGKVAAMVTTFSAYRQHPSDQLALASLPRTFVDSKENYVWLKGRSFSISSRSTNQLLAMDWIKEMTSPDAAVKMWAEAKQLPTLLPSLKSQAIRGDVNAKSYEWLLDHAIVMPAHPETSKKLTGMLPELQKLQKGEYDVKTFAGQMTKLWAPAKK